MLYSYTNELWVGSYIYCISRLTECYSEMWLDFPLRRHIHQFLWWWINNQSWLIILSCDNHTWLIKAFYLRVVELPNLYWDKSWSLRPTIWLKLHLPRFGNRRHINRLCLILQLNIGITWLRLLLRQCTYWI